MEDRTIEITPSEEQIKKQKKNEHECIKSMGIMGHDEKKLYSHYVNSRRKREGERKYIYRNND